MKSGTVFLLPGLDGQVDMLSEFVSHRPPETLVVPIGLPNDPNLGYDGLCEYVAIKIGDCKGVHIVAESFSGPIAILLAYRYPELVGKLSLVATFARSPAPWFAHFIPWLRIMRREMPDFVASYFLGADAELAKRMRDSILLASPESMEHRIRCVLSVDVRKELAALNCPVEYVQATEDRLVPKRALRTILSTNENVTVHRIKAPHLVLQTKPKQVWNCLRDAKDIY